MLCSGTSSYPAKQKARKARKRDNEEGGFGVGGWALGRKGSSLSGVKNKNFAVVNKDEPETMPQQNKENKINRLRNQRLEEKVISSVEKLLTSRIFI